MAIGFTVPFVRATGSLGYFETTNDYLSAAKENLKSLLLTNWGERPCNYYLGCNMKEFLFENVGSELKERIADRIVSQVERWLPYLTMDTLNISSSEDDRSVPENSLKISINFFLNSRPDMSSRVDVLLQ